MGCNPFDALNSKIRPAIWADSPCAEFGSELFHVVPGAFEMITEPPNLKTPMLKFNFGALPSKATANSRVLSAILRKRCRFNRTGDDLFRSLASIRRLDFNTPCPHRGWRIRLISMRRLAVAVRFACLVSFGEFLPCSDPWNL